MKASYLAYPKFRTIYIWLRTPILVERCGCCRAVPGFLFSPDRLQELGGGGGGRRPRYQDLPLEYSQPGSVDSITAMDCPASPRPVSRLLGSQPLESPGAATPAPATSTAPASLVRPIKVATSTAAAPSDTQASPSTSLTPSSPKSSYSALNSSPTSRKGPASRATAVPDFSSVKARSTPSSAVFISPRKRTASTPAPAPATAPLTSRGSWRFSASPPPEPYHPAVTVDSGLLDPTPPPVPATAPLLPKRQKVENTAGKTEVGTGKRAGRRLQCRECGARCSSLREVGSHTCRPRLPCWDCRPVVTTFHSRRELVDHLVLSHPAGPRQPCPHCLDRIRTFPTKTALQEHLRTRHPGMELPGSDPATAPGPAPAPAITSDPAPAQSNSLLPVEQPRPPVGTEELGEVRESGTAVEVGGARYEVEEVEVVVSDRAEQEVDAPDSVQSQQPDTPAAPFICLLCGKGFQTNLRHSNHKLHCTGGTRARPATGAAQRGRSGNARFAELRVHWTDLLAGRQRCPKCGRTNYSEAELADHSVACRGQLLHQVGTFKNFQDGLINHPTEIRWNDSTIPCSLAVKNLTKFKTIILSTNGSNK